MKLAILTTGGTIDKVYFDAKSDYKVGEPQIKGILERVGVTFPFDVTELFYKDSLEITDEDRANIVESVANCDADRVIVTHGTDTMVDTARALKERMKTVVLVGSLTPARFRETDAEFNIGVAVGAAQSLGPGVYLAMNGRIFDPESVRKNREENRFESI
ncbi:MAG: asparaginase [Bacteroidetes bacterium]|nr:asparaginase [Bacteroidota bacterium]